jgi:hypothetical protein
MVIHAERFQSMIERLARGFCMIAALALAISAARASAADADVPVQEPSASAPAAARAPDLARWRWAQQDAQVAPTGDLAWAPQPFRYEPGKVVRYIDFDAGSDDSDGASATSAWKHHPWDPAAAGKAKAQTGSITYVFKRGVVYRGELRPAEDGAAGDPIRLTADPAWGAGAAVICGSEQVAKWTKGADRAEIPDADTVWWADLDFAPRCVWIKHGDAIQRIELAREPNWTVSDPDDVRKGWYVFHQPGDGWGGGGITSIQGHRAHIGFDPKDLTKGADAYVGAVAHVEYGIVMSTPFPTAVEGFDDKRKGIIFQGIWFGDSERILTGCHFYLEDKPQFLDSPGEFWFAKKGGGGRLYLRLPGDADPNAWDVEAAKRVNLIESRGISHLAVSGLTFRFTNVAWDLVQPWWGEPNVDGAAIRIRGAAEDIAIANCRFDHCSKAVRIDATASVAPNGGEKRDGEFPIGPVAVADNDIDQTDHGAITIVCHRMGDISILRNHLHEIGLRTFRQDHSHAIDIEYPRTMEVGGNVIERCTGAGLFLFGGKGEADDHEIPLTRNLVHHNKVVDSLLGANDWGGIETWYGGPFYLYDNISARPNGTWWGWFRHNPGSGSDGFAYYHDHAYKNYDFNDIAYGASIDPNSQYSGAAGYQEACPTVENALFNCTDYRFWNGSNWSPAGGRHLFLGNVFDDIGCFVFRHGQLKEDKGPAKEPYPHHSMAYGSNVFSRVPSAVKRDAQGAISSAFGVYEVPPAGSQPLGYGSPADMAASFAAHHGIADDVGILAPESPLMDPEKGDLRPKPGSAASGRGVKVFVPWGLARTVGEWLFRKDGGDAAHVNDGHFYMMPYYVDGTNYRSCPMNNLTIVNDAAGDHVPGPLEDWCDGALAFNGKDLYATITQAEMAKPYEYTRHSGSGRTAKKERVAAAGLDLATPDIGATSMIVEAYLQAKGPGVLVSKIADSGYQLAINKAGGATFTVRAGGSAVAAASGAIIADGKWHHLLAEFDRAAGTLTVYTDGIRTASAKAAIGADASLANDADFLVGKGNAGSFFSGALEFLRVTRSSLSESATSIEELYDWELDGPFLRDFAGNAPAAGKKRDAGALTAAP